MVVYGHADRYGGSTPPALDNLLEVIMASANFAIQDISRALDLYYATLIWRPEEMMVKIRNIVNKYFTEVNDEDRG